ncbi:MAG TPA: hypothetical protein VMV78_12270 [Thiobacillus sp.]|nr:hypothetical protein [Thiobacillus sp.]
MTWKVTACALAGLAGFAIIGLVSVVWAHEGEISIHRERVDGLRSDIADMRAAIEKKLDRIEDRLNQHLDQHKQGN